jgi:cobaltochelatase CobN
LDDPTIFNYLPEGLFMVKIAFITTHMNYFVPFTAAAQSVYTKYSVKSDGYVKTVKDLEQQSILDGFVKYARNSQVVIVHFLGNKENNPHLRKLLSTIRELRVPLIVAAVPFDKELTQFSNVDASDSNTIFQYINSGGVDNFENLILFASNHFAYTDFPFNPPKLLPWDGLYHPQLGYVPTLDLYLQKKPFDPKKATVGVVFHQVSWRNCDLTFIDSLIAEIEQQGANALAVFVSSKTTDPYAKGLKWAVEDCFINQGKTIVDVVLSTLSFSVSVFIRNPETADSLFKRLGVPILKVIETASTFEEWRSSPQGLGPAELCWNIALPEFDGKIITVPCATKQFSEPDSPNSSLFTYQPIPERINKIVRLGLNWAKLRRLPNSEKRVAIIFHNYPPRNDNIGNAHGLDSAASVMNITRCLQEQGYLLDHLPENGPKLMDKIINGLTNERRWLSSDELSKRAVAKISKAQYERWFAELPADVQEKMFKQWGPAPGKLFCYNNELLVPGIVNGNVFYGLQPSRGFLDDPAAIYHSPDIPPPHQYYAYYHWIRNVFKADVIMHIGKHGSLEWLPGKSAALSESCFPDIMISDLPNIYPYIINNPGEGTQAKRRSYCCIIDHLVPVMHNADSYEDAAALEVLLKEYYDAKEVDHAKLPILQRQIWEDVVKAKLDLDLKVTEADALSDFDAFLERLHGYISELSDTLIRDGLHIFGEPPSGTRLDEFLSSLTRLSNGSVPSLRQSIAELKGYDYDLLLADRGKLNAEGRTNGVVVAELSALSVELVHQFHEANFDLKSIDQVTKNVLGGKNAKVEQCLSYISTFLAPALAATTDELTNTLSACSGGFVPAGPSGPPTRGMADILPTGRNFYSVDPRAIPTRAAWRVGSALGDALLARYLKDEGKYPESVAFVLWATDTMKTKGDDIAEILYLMGVRPVWAEGSGRVVGMEVMSLEELKRPRIDVMVRISGMFRDAFLNLAHLFDEAVAIVAELKETGANNFVRKHVSAEVQEKLAQGISVEEAHETSCYRVFGDMPGAYGCGISKAIDSKNWKTQQDLADVYVTWGCYAYSRKSFGSAVPEQFKRRLSQVNVTAKNDDSRETDILLADDWYDFHGGLITAVKTFSGKTPQSYCGDSSDPDRVKVRTTAEETCHVFRSRILNPKYIEGMKRHGYKGASDLSRCIDYVLGWDATTDVVEDWMYESLANKYVLDEKMHEWLKEVNPYALQNMIERLLEAIERGLWKASEEMKKELQQLYLQIEGLLEGANEKK